MNEEPDLLENLKSFQFRGFVIPAYMHHGIDLYVNHHKQPGDFLTAVIENDLSGAVGRADDNNLYNFLAYPSFFYQHVPSICWGSPIIMSEWLKNTK